MFDTQELDDIRERRAEWKAETLEPTLDAHGERKDRFA
ncbi:methylmalonyl-CoA mutase large subunit, partial [Natrinema gari JCM 14663]